MATEVNIPIDKSLYLPGHYTKVDHAKAWLIFVHGSGSSRFSSRNNHVANSLNKFGYNTLLFDLLTAEEDEVRANRFDIPLLSYRLQRTVDWLEHSNIYDGEPIALFGASTGAAAALTVAGNSLTTPIYTVISRGGRPDLATQFKLRNITVPVLLIVGSLDKEVIQLNQLASNELQYSELILIEGATHLFEEAGTLDQVIDTSVKWLDRYLPRSDQRSSHV